MNNTKALSPKQWPSEFPCFLCGDLKEICTDKNNKPYFVCHTCGVQCFIRGKEGIRRFIRIKTDRILNRILDENRFPDNSEILSLTARIEALDFAIKNTDHGVFSSDEINEKIARFKTQKKDFQKRLNKLLDSE